MSDTPEPPTDSQAVPDPTDGPQYCAYTDYRSGEVPEDTVVPKNGAGSEGLEREIWDALFEVEDPEMPVSVVDLGLVYDVAVREDETGTHAEVTMTLTYTGCPARDMLLDDVREAAASPEGVDDASVELVWSPVWSVEFVSEAGREDLREFGVSI
ncbi:1,2-phenylacetyl-CoA epoxidase subunit PaaD [Halomarina salina]|uniref:1,2-phenylacetyl-CoA epoxidase subunit PaaD n=1 Tax=Halomarina salina TaxID=1872699 RepID=A0ABD5RM16_9EURY|nr:1,2-phenylacetyl-CoA epoxidase subunit PaaD [Halomarina salina]